MVVIELSLRDLDLTATGVGSHSHLSDPGLSFFLSFFLLFCGCCSLVAVIVVRAQCRHDLYGIVRVSLVFHCMSRLRVFRCTSAVVLVFLGKGVQRLRAGFHFGRWDFFGE